MISTLKYLFCFIFYTIYKLMQNPNYIILNTPHPLHQIFSINTPLIGSITWHPRSDESQWMGEKDRPNTANNHGRHDLVRGSWTVGGRVKTFARVE